MAGFIQRVMHPDWYHGHGKSAPFFEGWYYKLINKAETERYAFIPGIFIHEENPKTHAFIQVLDGMTGQTTYHTYYGFEAAHDKFEVRVGKSIFAADRIVLDIDDEHGQIRGELKFDRIKPWPVSLTAPGIMGWYGWLPFMECNHGVVSLDHAIEGTLNINGKEVDFNGGRGYAEKDWGEAFPSGHVWMQSNHFESPETSLTASIATIPGVGRVRRPFAGFIVGLLHDGLLHRFATYTGAKVDRLVVTDTRVEWVMSGPNQELRIMATRAQGGLLKAPVRTEMHTRIDETMQAVIDVELYEVTSLRRRLMYKGQGRNAGMEVAGELDLLLKS